jgi:predicted enzyme related to lactoylglutathione lyase
MARERNLQSAKDPKPKGGIEMKKIFFNIPTNKNKLEESLTFYAQTINFKKVSDESYYLINDEYPNVGLGLMLEKNRAQSERGFLSFHIEKNLPTLCSTIKNLGIDIDIVTDMLGDFFVARFNDPSGNLIQISCDSLADDSGTKFEVSMID